MRATLGVGGHLFKDRTYLGPYSATWLEKAASVDLDHECHRNGIDSQPVEEIGLSLPGQLAISARPQRLIQLLSGIPTVGTGRRAEEIDA